MQTAFPRLNTECALCNCLVLVDSDGEIGGFSLSGCTLSFNFSSGFAGKHVASTCDVEISPPSVVVRFGDPLRANCAALTDQIQGMGWESSQGGKPLTTGVTSLALSIVAVTDWELRAFCFLNSLSGGQCMKPLAITVYSKF